MTLVGVSFVVIFVLILFAVSVGMKFFDARRKNQMVNMLHTAAGEQVVTITNLLKEIEPDKKTGFAQILNSLHFAQHAQEQILQAGLTWSAVIAPWGLANCRVASLAFLPRASTAGSFMATRSRMSCGSAPPGSRACSSL